MLRWLARAAAVVLGLAAFAAPTQAAEKVGADKIGADSNSRAANILGLPSALPIGREVAAAQPPGYLMVCGGGALPAEVYDEFVRLAGGKAARLVLIPSAYNYGSPQRIEYRFKGWRSYDVTRFDFLDTDTREKADTAEFIRPLEQATGVWMSGGLQSRLSGLYAGTKVEEAIKKVLVRGGVVSGTSAGAAAMSRVMIRYGRSQAVVDRGLGLLDRAVVDQHFTERNRQMRLMGVIEQNPDLVGLGVDEGTALVVQGNRLKVMGRAKATVYVRRDDSTAIVPIHAGYAADLAWKATGERPRVEVQRVP